MARTKSKTARATSATYTQEAWRIERDGILFEAYCLVRECAKVCHALTFGQLTIWLNEHEREHASNPVAVPWHWPLPALSDTMPTTKEEKQMAKELKARELPPLGEFVNITEIGQSIAGRAEKFKVNDNGEFVTLRPAMIRNAPGGEWWKFDTLAFALSTDARFKLSESRDKHTGQWLFFQLVDREPTAKGSKKKIFKVMVLEASEVAKLQARAIDKSEERATQIGNAPDRDPRKAPSIWGSSTDGGEAEGEEAALDL